MLTQKSEFIMVNEHQLHLRHIFKETGGQPVLMVHGAIENGRIFYTESGKGLACYLAEQGFDVYVADLRGRGDCEPRLQPFDNYGQYESINEDLPETIRTLAERTGQTVHLVAHSWGGVLLTAAMARYPDLLPRVRSKVYFGTKRHISVFSLERLIKIELLWCRFGPWVSKKIGYLPAKKWGMGSDDETIDSLAHSSAWVKEIHWRDPHDEFDYAAACQGITWPPSLFLAGENDSLLGHPTDVQRFIKESNNLCAEYRLLSVANGSALDYDHINMLTHPKAVDDHFPQILNWYLALSH